MNPHELKQLETRRSKLSAELKTATIESDAVRRRVSTLRSDIDAIDRLIAQGKQSPTITEHAVLRYAERAWGLSLEDVKRAILTPQVVATIQTIGSGRVPIGGGFVAVVKDKVVVSIVPST